MMEFVDLQRQFYDVPEDAELEETEHLVSLSQHEFGSNFGWSKLLKSKRVILLAEAGSGKTREMEDQAKRHIQEGRFAFFVALESLDREPIIASLSPDEEERFRQWKASSQEPAWFFLDAVDELKLTEGKLDRALKRLSRDLGGLLGRARVIISCRPSDWRPIADLNTVQNRLPIPQRRGNAPSQSSEEVFIEALRRDLGHTSPNPNEDLTDWDDVRIVKMLPMNDTQIKRFAEQSGVADVAAFLNEIDRQNVWTFARRPLDLSDLIVAWTNSGRLGTRAQQHEDNVKAKLKDDPSRPDRGVLSDTKAQLGAERLALALVLTRTRTIRAPEQAPHTRATDGVLDPAEVLTDWTEEERQALLRRALFDPATYGRVRFHHRSVQEYLAAQRLRTLREEGMSIKALFRLLFAERYGVKVVLPSMRAIAAWLALRDDAVRKELINREPEVLLSAGDPGTLELAARKDLVRAFVAKYGRGDWRGLDFLLDDVRRLAHPELEAVIRACWRNEPANHDVRGLLLQLIWQGPVKGCADLAQIAARNPNWDAGHRIAAIMGLLACGYHDSVRVLADELLAHPESWPAEIVYNVVPDLFPIVITVEELVTVIGKRSQESDRIGQRFDWALRQIVEIIEPGSEQAIELRNNLADLIWRRREETQELYDIRSKFEHVTSALAMLCERQLPEASAKPSKELIRACVIASRFGSKESGGQEPVGRLRRRFETNSNWRNDAFWAELAFTDEAIPSDDARLRLRYARTESLVGFLDHVDHPWLKTALADESRPERRAVALCALIQDWHRQGQIPSELEAIRRNLKGDSSLGQLLAQWTAPHKRSEKLEKMEQDARNAAHAQDDSEAQRLEDWKKWREEILTDPDNAFSAEKSKATLYNLYHWLCAAKPDRARYSLWDKGALIRAFGPEVAALAETAFRDFWRTAPPTLWSGRSPKKRGGMPYDWIFGLQGLLAETSISGWTASLTSDEARTAVAYSTIELDDFAPCITDLAESHPKEVEEVIGDEVNAELRMGGYYQILPTLQHLMHANGNLKHLLIPRLITELKSWPRDFAEDAGPNWEHHLDQVLRILVNAKNKLDREAIAQQCVNRYESDPVGPLALVWLRGLFRFDAARGTETLLRGFADGNDPDNRERAVNTFASLFGRYDTVGLEIPDSDERARLLGQLVRHAYVYIRPEDDEVHEGVYTPDARDNAERARDFLLSQLLDTPGAEARRIVLELAEERDFGRFPDRLRLLARQRAATDAEFPPFTPQDVIAIDTRREAPPQDRDALFAVMMDRLDDLQHGLAHDDFSDRRTLRGIKEEAEMQRTLAWRIREKANGVYLVTREEEVAGGKRTDIRLSTTSGDQKAVIEVKIADTRWTLTDIERALREQLVGKYLRHANCKAGCLLLTCHDKRKYWIHPETRKRISFPGIIKFLNDKARALQSEKQHDVRIAVFGLDLTGPMPNAPGFEEKMAKAEDIIGRYRNTLHVLAQ